jgi:hypothetical protein
MLKADGRLTKEFRRPLVAVRKDRWPSEWPRRSHFHQGGAK